jgi:phosphoenolpyruvate---glycerone phosphotransferase subunit DhaK
VPAAGKPTFDPAEDEMEVGVGIHGEPGRRRVKLRPTAEIAGETVSAITADLGARNRRSHPADQQFWRNAAFGASFDV